MHNLPLIEKGLPLKDAKGAIILVHGRGGSAEDIVSLALNFPAKDYYIAAPQATGNTWYPYSFLAPVAQNEPWLSASVSTIQILIDQIAEVLPFKQIFIMGFSQGACLALESVARNAQAFGGVAAFTGGLIGDILEPNRYKGTFDGTPVFIGNSDHDPHVPESRSAESAAQMQKMDAKVSYKVYPGKAHTIITDEIKTVNQLFFRT